MSLALLKLNQILLVLPCLLYIRCPPPSSHIPPSYCFQCGILGKPWANEELKLFQINFVFPFLQYQSSHLEFQAKYALPGFQAYLIPTLTLVQVSACRVGLKHRNFRKKSTKLILEGNLRTRLSVQKTEKIKT